MHESAKRLNSVKDEVNKIVDRGVPSECAAAADWAPKEISAFSLAINSWILSYAFCLILVSSPNFTQKYTKNNSL